MVIYFLHLGPLPVFTLVCGPFYPKIIPQKMKNRINADVIALALSGSTPLGSTALKSWLSGVFTEVLRHFY